MKKVSVVIPVYGQWHLAKRNIDALLKFDRENIKEIIVVDDCSVDKNPYIFDKELVSVISNDRNKGYAGTVNNGLRRASSDIVVLLDSDAYPIAPFIKNLIEIYSTDETIGCIGFKTVDDNGIETGSYAYEPSVFGMIMGQQVEMRLKLHANKNILPYSCAVSFRSECLKEVGYFNESLFPVLDADLDVCMNIHRSKWKLKYIKELAVSHMGGNSYKVNHKRVVIFYASRWKLLRKHGLITHPAMVKTFMKLRVKSELIIFKFLSAIRADSVPYDDKIKGRTILLNEIDSYI